MALGKRVKQRRLHLGYSQEELAKMVGVTQSAIQALEQRDSKSSRNASKLANALQTTVSWLEEGRGDVEIQSLVKVQEDTVRIESHDHVAFSMGVGMSVDQGQYEVKSFETSRSWVRSKLSKVSAMENVKIITGLGDSMSGLYEDGDALFCDTGVSKVDIDAVFAFRYHDELYIKRVQRIPGGRLKMISDNPKYEPFVVDHADRDDFQVLGRIVGTLNFQEV